MNILISGVIGGLLAIGGTLGGLSAYQSDPTPIPQDQLYTYADQ